MRRRGGGGRQGQRDLAGRGVDAKDRGTRLDPLARCRQADRQAIQGRQVANRAVEAADVAGG